ncbi:MAG: hypothetical protein QM784_30365 [Polyangiaceae bacterium]
MTQNLERPWARLSLIIAMQSVKQIPNVLVDFSNNRGSSGSFRYLIAGGTSIVPVDEWTKYARPESCHNGLTI